MSELLSRLSLLSSAMRRDAPHSYTLKKVTTFLDTEGLVYETTHQKNDGIYPTGCRVSFPNTDVLMSIQTNPSVAGPYFVETAILTIEGILYIPSLGYDNVIIHNELENLVVHLREMKNSLEGRNTVDFPDAVHIPYASSDILPAGCVPLSGTTSMSSLMSLLAMIPPSAESVDEIPVSEVPNTDVPSS